MTESTSAPAFTEDSSASAFKIVRKWLGQKGVVLGGSLLLMVLVAAVFAPVLSPFDPEHITPSERLLPPSSVHWVGTDHLGRDVFSRIIHGARISLYVGTMASFLATLVGTALGIVGATVPRLGFLVMRALDGLMAFPSLILAIALMAALGASVNNVIIALTLVYTPRIARVARGAVLSLKELEFVTAAVASGASPSRVVGRYILPNAVSPLIVQATFIFAYAILAEASLSFLGVGVSPGVASWGNMINEGRLYLQSAPWASVAPGFGILIAVLGANILGDAIRDQLDPRLKD